MYTYSGQYHVDIYASNVQQVQFWGRLFPFNSTLYVFYSNLTAPVATYLLTVKCNALLEIKWLLYLHRYFQ